MKKRFFLIALLALMLLAFAACGQPASDESADTETETDETTPADAEIEEITINISHLGTSADGGTPATKIGSAMHQTMLKFKEVCEAESNGKITVNIYSDMTTATSDREVLELVGSNVSQIGTVPGFALGEFSNVKEFNIFDFPYLFKDSEEVYKFTDSGMLDDAKAKATANSGIGVYESWVLGWSQMASNKEIKVPADVAGMKIRCGSSTIQVETLKAEGASPISLATGEVFTAMQQGAIDGLIFAENIMKAYKYYDVCSNLTVYNSMPTTHFIIYNQGFYDGLSDGAKAIWDDAMAEAIKTARELGAITQAENIDILVAGGMDAYYPTEEEMKEWKDCVSDIIVNYADEAGGADFVNSVVDLLAE